MCTLPDLAEFIKTAWNQTFDCTFSCSHVPLPILSHSVMDGLFELIKPIRIVKGGAKLSQGASSPIHLVLKEGK